MMIPIRSWNVLWMCGRRDGVEPRSVATVCRAGAGRSINHLAPFHLIDIGRKSARGNNSGNGERAPAKDGLTDVAGCRPLNSHKAAS